MKLLILSMYLIISLNARRAERLVRDKLIGPLMKRNNPNVDDYELFERSDNITDVIFIMFHIIAISLILTGIL